ncbi:class I SAM-dependent methyltransferase [Nostoc sp. CMAA1605]|uniref:class I SAM-dependent methyltransferase n=1 Tax=Nostoc sp. CMAA1605 TaxID=2055159 RepID=UPI001F2BD3CD|nr:class I SAM-dependent methyltransferase [Nostoc sp. CMAA1605]MCF4969118.1 class I SAM-dependent methyltransferase [Nostoc sp. CMAA1605]
MSEIIVKSIASNIFPKGDYVSPGLATVKPDSCFPNMILGNKYDSSWFYLRRNIPHNFYVDKRRTGVGFVSRDEAHILYNTALKFQGKKALEIGCWMGWSACHLALGGVELDVIDPMLSQELFSESVTDSLKKADVQELVNLIPGYSPQKVEEIANKLQRKWSLIFIDGHHETPAPLNDAMICEQFAEPDALILFHDLASPDVGAGLDYLKAKGWNTMVYQTMQIMGVAWRGNVEPVIHQPDPTINWQLPPHLHDYLVSGVTPAIATDKFLSMLKAIQPYIFLSKAQLFSLYSQVQQGYDYSFWLPKIFRQAIANQKQQKSQVKNSPN